MNTFDKEAVVNAAEAAWAGSPELRHEFLDNKETFIAYRCAVAAGRVKAASPAIEGKASRPTWVQPLDDHHVRALAAREWQESAAVRAEFGNNQERYLAWRVAESRGAIRVHGRCGVAES